VRTESPPAPGRAGPDRWRGLLHDVGHGLAAVSYLAEALRADPALSGTARARLDLLARELERLLALVAGESGGTAEPVELRGLLAELAAARDRPGHAAVLVRPGAGVRLRTAPIPLWRMLTNLVDNAVRAAGPGGEVQLGARTERDRVAVEITDDGPGFDRAPPGVGLGVVRGLARACGARLLLERRVPRGTRARLVFPAD